MNKAMSEKHHAIKRARERYGIFLDENAYHFIINCIQRGVSQFEKHHSKRCSQHKVSLPPQIYEHMLTNPVVPKNHDGSIDMRVVYDRRRQQLKTVLPWVSDNKRNYYTIGEVLNAH